MPRYFFHLRCPNRELHDPSGTDLRDPDQAWEAARTIARDLMETPHEATVDWLACVFEVTDEAGEIVFELPFSGVIDVSPKLN
jgi:hypothetical protein